MNYYKFATYNTSYYFPQKSTETAFLYNLYVPYRFKIKVYWWLWQNVKRFQKHYRINCDLDFPFSFIKEIERKNSVMSFCMGTPGIEQKISILGYEPLGKLRFFSKFSQKPPAMKLSMNEITVLEHLQNTGFVPLIYDKVTTDSFVFFKTEYIAGKRFNCLTLTDEIVKLMLEINKYNFKLNAESVLSHGDFCPWNILNTSQGLRLIDWEMAKERPLGYDLFTYIFQPSFLFYPALTTGQIISKNRFFIEMYFSEFGISDYTEYLFRFAEIKMENEREKAGSLFSFYEKLYVYAKEI
jgi:tRNA A-37 threonylcarbamoyl transferase component Bud32